MGFLLSLRQEKSQTAPAGAGWQISFEYGIARPPVKYFVPGLQTLHQLYCPLKSQVENL